MPIRVTTRCEIDVKPIRDFQTMIVQDMRSRGGSIGNVIKEKWPGHYFEYLRKRYRQNASGGGDWPPLSEKTKVRGLGGKPATRKGIMRITDTLYDALIPGRPGNMIREVEGGVQCGVGGGARHPVAPMEIARLAAILSKTGKNRPARPIVVAPDQETITRMRISADRGFSEFIRKFAAATGGSKQFIAGQAGVNVPRNR